MGNRGRKLDFFLSVIISPSSLNWKYPVYHILSCVVFQDRADMAQLMSVEWGRLGGKGLWN